MSSLRAYSSSAWTFRAAWLAVQSRTLIGRLAGRRLPVSATDRAASGASCRLLAVLLETASLGLDQYRPSSWGYAEAASFSRAFKRWTSVSPDQWRRQRQTQRLTRLASARGEVRPEEHSNMLEITAVRKSYVGPQGRLQSRGSRFALRMQPTLALIGRVGSGKSTLLH